MKVQQLIACLTPAFIVVVVVVVVVAVVVVVIVIVIVIVVVVLSLGDGCFFPKVVKSEKFVLYLR